MKNMLHFADILYGIFKPNHRHYTSSIMSILLVTASQPLLLSDTPVLTARQRGVHVTSPLLSSHCRDTPIHRQHYPVRFPASQRIPSNMVCAKVSCLPLYCASRPQCGATDGPRCANQHKAHHKNINRKLTFRVTNYAPIIKLTPVLYIKEFCSIVW